MEKYIGQDIENLTEERDSIINGQIGLIEEEAPDILIVEV